MAGDCSDRIHLMPLQNRFRYPIWLISASALVALALMAQASEEQLPENQWAEQGSGEKQFPGTSWKATDEKSSQVPGSQWETSTKVPEQFPGSTWESF